MKKLVLGFQAGLTPSKNVFRKKKNIDCDFILSKQYNVHKTQSNTYVCKNRAHTSGNTIVGIGKPNLYSKFCVFLFICIELRQFHLQSLVEWPLKENVTFRRNNHKYVSVVVIIKAHF